MNNNDETLLINILNTMYNDNLRQIHNLQDSNNQIRRLLTDFLSTRRTSRQNRPYRRSNVNWYNTNLDYQRTEYQEQLQNIANLSRETIRQEREMGNVTRDRNTVRERNRIGTSQINTINQLLQHFFDTIEVFPTQTQIENATRIALYRDIVNPNNQSCPISLVPFNDEDRVSVIRHCGHIFHTEELLHWFRTNCRCPVCRYDIRNYNINSNGSQNNINYNNSIINENVINENVINENVINENAINENAINENVINENDINENDINENAINENETSERLNNTSSLQDISGNLLGILTDALLNNFLNTYTGNSNVSDPFFIDVIFDSSNNIITYPNISQSRYYTFPYRRQ